MIFIRVILMVLVCFVEERSLSDGLQFSNVIVVDHLNPQIHTPHAAIVSTKFSVYQSLFSPQPWFAHCIYLDLLYLEVMQVFVLFIDFFI